jgi:hypothetical protein
MTTRLRTAPAADAADWLAYFLYDCNALFDETANEIFDAETEE